MCATTSDGFAVHDFQRARRAARRVRDILHLQIEDDVNTQEVPGLLKQMRNYHWSRKIYDKNRNFSPEFKVPLARFIDWLCNTNDGNLGISKVLLVDGLGWLRPIIMHEKNGVVTKECIEIQGILRALKR
jgi:hypothetical protein